MKTKKAVKKFSFFNFNVHKKNAKLSTKLKERARNYNKITQLNIVST